MVIEHTAAKLSRVLLFGLYYYSFTHYYYYVLLCQSDWHNSSTILFLCYIVCNTKCYFC